MGKNAVELLQQAISEHRLGHDLEAERLYRNTLLLEPLNAVANHNLGLILDSKLEITEAILLFKAATEISPASSQFWISYIEALIKDRQCKEASLALENANDKGLPCATLETLKKSLSSLDSSTTLGGQIPEFHVEKIPPDGKIQELLNYYQCEDFIVAENLAKSLVHEFPKHQPSWTMLGEIFRQNGKYFDSSIAHQTALEISDNSAANYNLALSLQEQDRFEEAETYYRKAIEMQFDYVDAHYNLGLLLQNLERFEEAEISYRHALNFRPEFAMANNNLGLVLQEQGRLNEAEIACRTALEISDNSPVNHNLARILQEQDRFEEAETYYRKAIEMQFDYVDAHYNLGLLLQNLERFEEAEISYRHALNFRPEFAMANNNLELVLQELGRSNVAEANFSDRSSI